MLQRRVPFTITVIANSIFKAWPCTGERLYQACNRVEFFLRAVAVFPARGFWDEIQHITPDYGCYKVGILFGSWAEQLLRWQCPRCGVDLTELIQSGKVVVTRIEADRNSPERVEEQVHCLSCDKLVNPELITSP